MQRLALGKSVHFGLFHTYTLFCTFLRWGQRHLHAWFVLACAQLCWSVPTVSHQLVEPWLTWLRLDHDSYSEFYYGEVNVVALYVITLNTFILSKSVARGTPLQRRARAHQRLGRATLVREVPA